MTSRLIRPELPQRRLALPAMALAATLLAGASTLDAQASFTPGGPDDPRIGLGAGWMDAESASWNMEHLSFTPRPEGF